MADFQTMAEQVAAGARAIVRSRLAAPDVRRILRFFSKVALVLDQAVEDVLALAIDLSYIRDADLTPQRVDGFRRELDMVTARSHYRDMEEICSRLGMLREQYDQQLRPLLRDVDTAEWGSLFSLIDEREGYVVYLARSAVEELKSLLGQGAPAAAINAEARRVAESMRKSLADLRTTTNAIFGLSGSAGLMELTSTDRGVADAPIMEIYDMSNSKNISFGNNATVHGPVVNADSIDGSFNSSKDPALDAALDELARQAQELCRRLPADERAVVERRLNTLRDESKAKNPDPSMLQVSAKGLVEAAKTVAELAGPVKSAVAAVLGILGVMM